MGILQNLSVLALRQALPTLIGAVAGETTARVVNGGAELLLRHLSDKSERYLTALATANERAWKALEIALAGNSLLERGQVLAASGEDKAFRQQLQAFIEANPLPQFSGKDQFRQKCLHELRTARQRKLLTGDTLNSRELAHQTATFLGFADPQALHVAEQNWVKRIIEELQKTDCPGLAWLLAQQVQAGTPLVVVTVRYFFRRQVETDEELARGLTFTQLDQLTQTQILAYQGLNSAIARQGQVLEEILARLTGIQIVITGIAKAQGEHGRKLDQILQQMQHLAAKASLDKAVRPGLSIRNEQEFQVVKQLLAQFRNLPEAERRKVAVNQVNMVGKLELETGELGAAERTFRSVAQSTSDPAQKAEAHFNAYRVALEKKDWTAAFQQWLEAVKLDGNRFASFPVARYHPLRILGAGGFGVVFLCQHKFMNAKVVVKTLMTDGTEQNADKVFHEAQLLTGLQHPAIIGVSDCGYAIPASKSRPYLVMNYFEGVTLQEYVDLKGPLHPYDLWLIVQQLAEGLLEAHGRGILHRDIKPANILVCKDDDGWEAKIIDFGLALKQDILQQASAIRSLHSQSTVDYSVTGTLDYAPPEQLGKLHGVPVGTYSDVYSFGKTCCYALFQTTQPSYQHWQKLKKPALSKWLDKLIVENPADRFGDFEAVLDKLPKMNRPRGPRAKKAATTDVDTPTPPAASPSTAVASSPRVEVASKLRLSVVRGQKPNVSYVMREGIHVLGRSIDPREYVEQLMVTLDRNKDGRISREEAAGSQFGELFEKIDVNKDGFLSKEELLKAASAAIAAQSTPVTIDLRDQDAPNKMTCSRNHARIIFQKGEATIEDMNSRNGTFINRTRLTAGQRVRLQDDDVVQLGQVHLEVELE